MTRLQRHRSTRRLGQRGTALIEFTLVLPLLLIITVAAIDFGRAFFVKNVLEQSARAGARLMAVTSDADSAVVQGRVLAEANAAGINVSRVVRERFGNRQIRVTVEGEFNWIFPGVFNLFGAGYVNPMTLTGHAVMRDETSG